MSDAYELISTLCWDALHSPETESSLAKASTISRELLPYHRDRLLASAIVHGFTRAIDVLRNPRALSLIEGAIDDHLGVTYSPESPAFHSRFRIRISLNDHGSIHITSAPLLTLPRERLGSETPFVPRSLSPPNQIPAGSVKCTVTVSSQAVQKSIFTAHKTSHRDVYVSAQRSASIDAANIPPTEAEVLLRNTDGEIMECATSSVYFFRELEEQPEDNKSWTDIPSHGTARWITPPLSVGCCDGVTRRIALERRLCKEGVVMTKEIRDGELVWLSNAVRGFWIARVVA